MAKMQLDQELDAHQVESLISFLVSLTGEIPKNYRRPVEFNERRCQYCNTKTITGESPCEVGIAGVPMMV